VTRKKSKQYLLFGLFSALCLTLVTIATIRNLKTQKPTNSDAAPSTNKDKKADFVPGEVLVTFKEDLPIPENVLGLENDTSVSDPRLKKLKQKNIEKIERISKKEDITAQTKSVQHITIKPTAFDRTYKLTIQHKEKADTLRLVDELKKDVSVEEVTPNYIRYTSFTPNDPFYAQQWALNNSNTFDINAPEVWEQQKGSSNLVIAVVDSGVYFPHPDLQGRTFINSGETGQDSSGRDKKTNGVDDDGNGFVDDWQGYDMTTCAERLPFIGICQTSKSRDNDPLDDNGHGTHVSGIIGAIGNNSIGIAGVNWNSKILPVKVIGKEGGGPCSDILAGIAYASKFAKIINLSLGGSSPCAGEDSLFNSLYAQNIVVIAAAGNESTSERSYPAASPHVISIAALDKTGVTASFSNYGDWVDLAAPGVDILSTIVPGIATGCDDTDGDGYMTCSGTSMASPYAVGVASLILSKNPNLTALQVFNILANSAKDIAPAGRDDYSGYGLIDAQKALTDMNIIPPPQVIISSPSDFMLVGRTVEIRGTAVANGFVKYELSWTPRSTTNWQTTGITIPSATTQVQDGILGTFTFPAVNPGEYFIRLTVTTNTTTYTTNKYIIFDTTIGGAWPKPVGRADSVTVSDVNNDAKKEIIVQGEEGINVFTNDGLVYSNLWPKPITFENVEFTKAPVVGNLVQNTTHPGKQIIYSVLHADSTFDINAFYADGTVVPGWPQKGRSDSGTLGNQSLVDLNGDGLDELVYLTVPTDDKLQLIARKGDGSILPGWENVIIDSAYTERIGSNSMPVAANINTDAQKEIIVSTYEGTYPLGQAKVQVYSSTGTKIWEYKIQANSGFLYDTYLTAGDITGDGIAETIVLYGTQDLFFNQHMHLLVLNQNGQVLPQFNSLDLGISDVYATLMLADMTGDGKPEIIVSDEWDGAYTIIDPEGHRLPGFPFVHPTAYGPYNAVGDVDGNGSMELSWDALTVNQDLSTDSYSDLLTYNKTNGSLSSFPLFPKHYGLHSLPKSHVLTDLDNDGKTDYVTLTSSSLTDYLYAFKIGLPPGKLEWPQYLHDEKHTNAYTKAIIQLKGDANSDGVVDGIDFTIWLTNYGRVFVTSPGASGGDFNGDGKVDGIDFTIWLTNYGKRV
jgi:subtilisin family serine protease